MRSVYCFYAISTLAGVCSAVPYFKRADYSGITLYAYGGNATGYPICCGQDGLAYISGSDNSSSCSQLTWDINTDQNASWNGTVNNNTQVGSFYIVNGNSSYEPAGFVSKNGTAPTSSTITTIGFSLVGSQVVYTDDSEYKSMFWAKATGNEETWSLMWNSDGSFQENSVPVTIKLRAPPTIDK